MTGKNNNIIKTDSPIDYETAQRFIADFNFIHDYRERFADSYNNSPPSPIYFDVLSASVSSILESSEMLLEQLFDAFPAEFFGYEAYDPREMTPSESSLLDFYLRNKP